MAASVRELSGAATPLQVTSAVRDREYQDLLVRSNPQATEEYSLHTTGWSFDIRRDYESKKQAQAFQYVLDRLRRARGDRLRGRAGSDPRHRLRARRGAARRGLAERPS